MCVVIPSALSSLLKLAVFSKFKERRYLLKWCRSALSGYREGIDVEVINIEVNFSSISLASVKKSKVVKYNFWAEL